MNQPNEEWCWCWMNYCVGLGVGDWGVYSSNAPVRGRVGRRGEDKRGKATQLRFLPSLLLRRGLTGEISCASRKRSSPAEIDSALAISYLATRPDEDTLWMEMVDEVRRYVLDGSVSNCRVRITVELALQAHKYMNQYFLKEKNDDYLSKVGLKMW